MIEALLGEQFGGTVGSDRWSADGRFPAKQRALCYATPRAAGGAVA